MTEIFTLLVFAVPLWLAGCWMNVYIQQRADGPALSEAEQPRTVMDRGQRDGEARDGLSAVQPSQ